MVNLDGMETCGDLVRIGLCALATWQTVEVLHHSRLALPLRQLAAATLDGDRAGRFYRIRYFLAYLLSCPFCLSHWVAGGLVLSVYLGFPWLAYIMAATRLANLGNDLAHPNTLTPKYAVYTETEDVPFRPDTAANQAAEARDAAGTTAAGSPHCS